MWSSFPPHRDAAAARLLDHCRALTRDDHDRPSALERLEASVGDEMARLLLATLAAKDPPAQSA